MVGAGVPRGGEVVLSTARLTELGPVDRAAAQVEAGAGVTLAALQAQRARRGPRRRRRPRRARQRHRRRPRRHRRRRHARRAPRDRPRPRRRAAGGPGRRRRSSTGPRCSRTTPATTCPALLVGSEGTLGVITRVRWRLVARLTSRVAALIALPSLEQAAALLADVRPRLPSLHAADFFLDEGLQLVLDHLGLPAPVPARSPVYVLLECAAPTDPTDELAAALGAGRDRGRGRGRRQRRARAAVALSRGAHRGDLGRGRPAQDRRRRPAGAAGRVRRRACARRWRAWRRARA